MLISVDRPIFIRGKRSKGQTSFGHRCRLKRQPPSVLLVIEAISNAMRSELKTSVLLELTFHRYGRQSLLMASNQSLLTERIKEREHRKGT